MPGSQSIIELKKLIHQSRNECFAIILKADAENRPMSPAEWIRWEGLKIQIAAHEIEVEEIRQRARGFATHTAPDCDGRAAYMAQYGSGRD